MKLLLKLFIPSRFSPFLLFPFLLGSSVCLAQQESRELPANFKKDRIFVQPVTTEGDTINFYTDTGGGGLLITSELTERLNLSVEEMPVEGQSMQAARLPDLNQEHSIPLYPDKISTSDVPNLQRMLDQMEDLMIVHEPEYLSDYEGMLGHPWFATRIWTFDYPNKKLLLHESYDTHIPLNQHKEPIYFQSDSQGLHRLHFPRIQAVIQEDTLDFLFDTGATLELTDSAHAALGDEGPALRGTSFITESQYEKWRSENPDWKVIEEGDNIVGGDLIQVPEVTIGGQTAGPVWFTTRPDKNFHEGMSRYMDQQVEGALGGSLFKYFRITVHYPEEYAVFEKE